MTDWPDRGQRTPDYWDNQLKAYVDEGDTAAAAAGTGAAATVQTNLTAHESDATDAHDASAISFGPSGNIAATQVQAAIQEVRDDSLQDGDTAGGVLSGTYPSPGFAVDMATQAELDAHITDPTDAHAGTAIANIPAGGIAAITVQAAINELDTEKAPLASPALTGNPTAPTASPGDNDTSVATTAFVTAADVARIAATIVDNDTTHSPSGEAVFEALALKAPLASPALTGNPTAPTASPGDSDTSIATTAFVATSFAPLASPALTGNPTAPTASPGDNDTSIATTAFVTAADTALIIDSIADSDTTHAPSRNAVFDALVAKAPLASPALTGNPTAPTPSPGDNDTSIATTAFVANAVGSPSYPYCELIASAAMTNQTASQWNKITLATTVHNDVANFSVSGSVITILAAGIYDISALGSTSTNTAGSKGIAVHKNGAATYITGQLVTHTTAILSSNALHVALAINDTIQLDMFSTVANDGTLHTADIISRLLIRKIG